MTQKEEIEALTLEFWQTMGDLVPAMLADEIDERGGVSCSEDLMDCITTAIKRATEDYAVATGIRVDLDIVGTGEGSGLQ